MRGSMTKEEEKEYYERNRERNLRFVRAKLPHASPREIDILAAFVSGLAIEGWSESEFNRVV